MEDHEKLKPRNSIEIRSEEIDEILGKKPNRLIRHGIMIITVVILLLFAGSYFFKYPDVISAPITMTTENLPVNLVSKVGGKLSQLFVQDKQHVHEGEVLAILENPADYNDIELLASKLDTLKYYFSRGSFITRDPIDTVLFEESLLLGQLQSDYISFLKSLNDFNLFVASDFQHKKIQSIILQKQKQYALKKKIMMQSTLTLQQLELTQNQFSRDSGLFQSRAIAQSDFEKSKNVLLQYRNAYESSCSNVDNSELTIAQLDQRIIELEQEYEEQYKKLFNEMSNTYQALINQITTWKQTYLLITPIDGEVSFTRFWSANQDVVVADNVFTIVPDQPEKVSGKVQMPVAGSGKVKAGQKVNIRLDNYPYMEYGILTGRVKSISLVPQDNQYYVEIDLPDGLVTTYGKTLPFSSQLQGTADIVTEDLRLIERFLKPLKSVIKSNTN